MQSRVLLNELPYSRSNAVQYLELFTESPYFHLPSKRIGGSKSQRRQIRPGLSQLPWSQHDFGVPNTSSTTVLGHLFTAAPFIHCYRSLIMVCDGIYYSYIQLPLVKSYPSEEDTPGRAPKISLSFSRVPGKLSQISLASLRLGPALVFQRVWKASGVVSKKLDRDGTCC